MIIYDVNKPSVYTKMRTRIAPRAYCIMDLIADYAITEISRGLPGVEPVPSRAGKEVSGSRPSMAGQCLTHSMPGAKARPASAY